MTTTQGVSVFEQQRDHTGQQSSSDFASDLRARALLTLRRRKPPSAAAIPGPPPRPTIISSSIQLDYGHEESSNTAPAVSSSSTTATNNAPAPVESTPAVIKSEPMDVDSHQAREEGEIEEGEISDSGTVPPTPAPNQAPAGSSINRNTSETNVRKTTSPTPSLPPPPSSEPPSSAPTSPDLAHGSAAPGPSQFRQPSNPPYIVDANHVRPGLAMTQAQYDTAKDIVLDLLGWGVPPEYLVTCGLSRQIVYYVFVELNLRLPANLDITGIQPYPPPSANSPVPTSSVPLQQPSPSALNTQFTFQSRLTQNPSISAGKFAQPASALNPSAAVFAPITPSVGTPAPNLLDMEQQRKQELLARKAAQASRKAKQAAALPAQTSPTSSIASSTRGDFKEPAIPTAKPATKEVDVDDFLKSIEPVTSQSLSNTPSIKSAVAVASTSDAMDVDEPIPGLSSGVAEDAALYKLRSTSPQRRSTSSSDSTSSNDDAPQASAAVTPSEQPVGNASADATVGDRTPSSNDNDIDMEIPGLTAHRSHSSVQSHISGSRRGLKRPVAADFVDMEPESSYPTNGYTSHGHSTSHRRKGGAFAGTGGVRRCIINLSDSEEEVEDGMLYDDSGLQSKRGSGPVSRAPSRYGMTSSALNGTASRRISPPGQSATPVALQEKEEEIRKMRDMIQEKERARLRKLALSGRSTPPASSESASTPATPIASVKQEDDDSAAKSSLERTPPLTIEPQDDPMNGLSTDEHEEKPALANLGHPASAPVSSSLSVSGSASTSSLATPIGPLFQVYPVALD